MGERVIEAKFNVHENYNKVKIINPYRYVSGGGGFDADAQAFIDATGITDSTQQSAINTLVIGLKADSLWSKMKAIYPFVGGTADTHKYNLKDPRDLDAAFRLTYHSGVSHSASGINSLTNGYCNTYLIEDTILTLDDAHISIYSVVDRNGLECDIGTDSSNIFSRFSGNFYHRLQNGSGGNIANSNSLGLFISNRTNSTQAIGFQNTTKHVASVNSISKNTNPFYLLAMNNSGSDDLHTGRVLSFATIGDGLDDIDATNFHNRVQAFQTTLNREV